MPARKYPSNVPPREGTFPAWSGWWVMLRFNGTPMLWGSYPRRTIAEAVEMELRRKRDEQIEARIRQAGQTKPRRGRPRRG